MKNKYFMLPMLLVVQGFTNLKIIENGWITEDLKTYNLL